MTWNWNTYAGDSIQYSTDTDTDARTLNCQCTYLKDVVCFEFRWLRAFWISLPLSLTTLQRNLIKPI
jgi:hypothetical protein